MKGMSLKAAEDDFYDNEVLVILVILLHIVCY